MNLYFYQIGIDSSRNGDVRRVSGVIVASSFKDAMIAISEDYEYYGNTIITQVDKIAEVCGANEPLEMSDFNAFINAVKGGEKE